MMSEQPGRGNWGDPPSTPGEHAPGPPADLEPPTRTSDFGRFDWFAESGQLALPGSAAAPVLPANAPARERRLRPGRRAVAVCILALACTALGGVVGGIVAVRTIENKPQDSSYS